MKLPARLLGGVATAGTVVANFWPWLAAAALLGAAPAGYATWKITRAFDRGAIAEAQTDAEKARRQLSELTTDIASRAAETQAEARRLQVEALEGEGRRQSAILSAIAAGWQQVLGQVQRDNVILRESIHAPEYDCLRLPYPDQSLRLLQRPGGAVSPVAAGDRADPGPATTP